MTIEHRHCEQIRLDPQGATWGAELREHAAHCGACVAFLQTVSALGARLRRRTERLPGMPEDLRRDLFARLDDARPAAAEPRSRASILRFPQLRGAMIPVALAASLAVGVLLGRHADFAGGLPPEVRRNIGMYIADVTHDHYLIERIGRPLEVAMTDPGELSHWLSESLSFDFQLPHTGENFRLEGGRVWHTVGRLSALASYRTPDGDRAILFAVPASNLDLDGAPSQVIDGTRVFAGEGWGRQARVWIEGDLAVALVAPDGDLPAGWAATFLPTGGR